MHRRLTTLLREFSSSLRHLQQKGARLNFKPTRFRYRAEHDGGGLSITSIAGNQPIFATLGQITYGILGKILAGPKPASLKITVKG